MGIVCVCGGGARARGREGGRETAAVTTVLHVHGSGGDGRCGHGRCSCSGCGRGRDRGGRDRGGRGRGHSRNRRHSQCCGRGGRYWRTARAIAKGIPRLELAGDIPMHMQTV